MTWFAALAKKRAMVVAIIAAVGLFAIIALKVSNDSKTGNAETVISSADNQEFAAQFKLFYPFTEARGLAPMEFRDDKGRVVTLKDYRGQFVLLHFWATWCAPCAAELPLLDHFQAERPGQGLLILPVSVDFEMPMVKIHEFMKKNGAKTLPALVGVQNDGIWEIVSGGLPSSLIIGPDGHVLYKMIGEADWTSEATRVFFDNLLKEKSYR